MNFVSIDIETTGLDEQNCQVIEIGAVIDGFIPLKDPPKFHCYVTHEQYKGEAYALSMHPKILRRLATEEGCYLYQDHDEVWETFDNWLWGNSIYSEDEKWTVAGKNYAGFDDRFLRLLPGWNQNGRLRHRVLDPGNMLLRPEDTCVPDTKECMLRCGLQGKVAHTALEDAEVVALMIQYATGIRCGL